MNSLESFSKIVGEMADKRRKLFDFCLQEGKRLDDLVVLTDRSLELLNLCNELTSLTSKLILGNISSEEEGKEISQRIAELRIQMNQISK